ncbi:MAG: O-antigen polymerase [Inconstantimicrobium porci]|uniref:O-antigen polymerase n=1 Tax=Inconstantimicrobium porci TaxID=2652291 RepID=UPI002A91A9F5|nr:O-antigen polymerase [Inconstantimicrobium porci]MDY5912884.1 O-antigen polymerase [Inconstantimicrobium porci]
MLIYILFAFFVVMLGLSYVLFKKEIMQPAVIFMAVYVVSIGCVLPNIEKWGVSLYYKTFWILFLGGVEFLLISYIIHLLYKQKYKKDSSNLFGMNEEVSTNTYQEIHVSSIFILLIIIYDIVFLVLLTKSVLNIASQFGYYSDFSQALTLFKYHASYANDAKLPDYINLMSKVTYGCSYVFLYFYLKGVIYSNARGIKKILDKCYYLIPVMVLPIVEFVQSSRASIIYLILAGVTMAVVIWSKKNKWNKHVPIKVISSLGLVAIIGLVLFYYSASSIGRINKKNLVDYVTLYCGGSIECFNQYVQHPENNNIVWGQETFGQLIGTLDEAGITNYNVREKLGPFKFIYYKGEMVGNVYTAYRRWLNDFGISGIVVLQAIMCIIVNMLYNAIKYSKLSEINKGYLILVYGYISYTIYMHPIMERFFCVLFTKANLGRMIMLTFLYYSLILIKIQFKGGLSLKVGKKVLINNKK